MKFHSLMAVVLLLLACDSGAAPAFAAAAAEPVAKAEATTEPAAFTYQNGDLVLDIQDAAGAEVLRVGLAYFFHDEHIATANEYPAGPVAPIEGTDAAGAAGAAQMDAAPLAEPLSLTLFGAGLALLGWTRRLGSQGLARNWKQRLVRAFWPWPSMSWLDS